MSKPQALLIREGKGNNKKMATNLFQFVAIPQIPYPLESPLQWLMGKTYSLPTYQSDAVNIREGERAREGNARLVLSTALKISWEAWKCCTQLSGVMNVDDAYTEVSFRGEQDTHAASSSENLDKIWHATCGRALPCANVRALFGSREQFSTIVVVHDCSIMCWINVSFPFWKSFMELILHTEPPK